MSADADRLAQIVDRVLVEGATTLPPDDLSLLAGEAHALRGALHLAMRALNTACGVLQEASGLPDEIDDPDARDDMVLTLRPRAEKAEAEVERLTDLCGEFRKREERLNAEVERLRGWIDRSERQEARARRAEAEVARLTAERDALAAQVARVEKLAGQWERLATTAINPDSREWLQACAATLRECLSGWPKMSAALADSGADTGEQEAGHRCEPYYSRSQCGQCGWQEQWCATCSRQMCGCATETTDQEDQA